MTSLILRRLTMEDEYAFLKAVADWDHHPSFQFLGGYHVDLPFPEYLSRVQQNERGENLPIGKVADTVLFGFVDERIVGRLSIRHELNEFLHQFGGHIGYGVLPEHRRKGYAREMLKQALPIAKALGLERVLVTCDDDNLGSIRTIESNGGALENVVDTEPGKARKRRYWIKL